MPMFYRNTDDQSSVWSNYRRVGYYFGMSMHDRYVTVLREAVASELRAEIARQRLTQAEVALALGRSQSTISEKLSGAAPILVEEFILLCDLLGKEAGAFLDKAMSEQSGMLLAAKRGDDEPEVTDGDEA